MTTIMPSFSRYPEEARLVGNILAGYGEIEYELYTCVSAVLGDDSAAFRTLFRLRQEGARLDVADALVSEPLSSIGLGAQYGQSLGAVRWCRKARNQYAHSHWIDRPSEGLALISLQDAAWGSAEPIMLSLSFVSLDLLREHEAYFCYARDGLRYLASEFRLRSGAIHEHPWSMPPQRPQPLLPQSQ